MVRKFVIINISINVTLLQQTINTIICISRERKYLRLSPRLDEEQLNSCLVALF